MRSITSALLVTVAFAAVATAPYLVFRDDSFASLIDHQTQTQTQVQISYDDQIDDLRAQIARMSRLDQERVEDQIAPAAAGGAGASHLGVSERSVDPSNTSTKRFAGEWHRNGTRVVIR
jgi:TolA-binding protein